MHPHGWSLAILPCKVPRCRFRWSHPSRSGSSSRSLSIAHNRRSTASGFRRCRGCPGLPLRPSWPSSGLCSLRFVSVADALVSCSLCPFPFQGGVSLAPRLVCGLGAASRRDLVGPLPSVSFLGSGRRVLGGQTAIPRSGLAAVSFRPLWCSRSFRFPGRCCPFN